MLISKIDFRTDSSFYKLEDSENPFFLASHAHSREMLNEPEMIGFNLYNKLKKPTENIVDFLIDRYKISRLNILNIMRGGLNFPIEEACYNLDLNREAISFITTERVFGHHAICKINIGYNKIALLDNATLIIGDIIASGETIRNTIRSVLAFYIKNKIKIKRIVILTIGTINTLEVVLQINREILKIWPDFEGVITFFYEGIFSVYKNQGITMLNTPEIDFSYKKGFITPEYKYSQLKHDTALFEKCPIYDGGARRFEPHAHIENLLTYWKQLCGISHSVNPHDFTVEKLGYGVECPYENWLAKNNYIHASMDHVFLENLYVTEKRFLERFDPENFIKTCNMRYRYLCGYFQQKGLYRM